MSDSYPASEKYMHPYAACSQCGNNCYGAQCLSPTCDYIERVAFNRFERPPVPTETAYACRSTPQTCKSVSSMFYFKDEYKNPLPFVGAAGCLTPNTFSDVFQVSQVRYASL